MEGTPEKVKQGCPEETKDCHEGRIPWRKEKAQVHFRRLRARRGEYPAKIACKTLDKSRKNRIYYPGIIVCFVPVRREGGQLADKDLRINEQIRVREVRLIRDDGEQKIMAVQEALESAREQGLDLVEVAPQANPPVVKILDYGKYKFENEKKVRDSKKKQKLLKLKEIRMQPKIDEHDLDFKSKHVREFLAEGNKVKVTVRFRGRELAHTELGLDVLKDVLSRIEGDYVMDKAPTMEGRFMSMVLSPKVKAGKTLKQGAQGPGEESREGEAQAKQEG
jgi:translation initiation factor IF-3